MTTPSQAELGIQAAPGLPPQSLSWHRYRRFVAWARRVNLERKLAVMLMLATVGAGTVTEVIE